jgi:hypothetical protein
MATIAHQIQGRLGVQLAPPTWKDRARFVVVFGYLLACGCYLVVTGKVKLNQPFWAGIRLALRNLIRP